MRSIVLIVFNMSLLLELSSGNIWPFRSVAAVVKSSPFDTKDESPKKLPNGIPIIILDVDGTLYEDNCLIEEQIKDLCHQFAHDHFNLTSEESQTLHNKYGSTICGLSELYLPRDMNISKDFDYVPSNKRIFQNYYQTCYPSLNKDRLEQYTNSMHASQYKEDNTQCFAVESVSKVSEIDGSKQQTAVTATIAANNPSGYHFTSPLHSAHTTLYDCPYPIAIASNCPLSHVRQVLQRLGLASLPIVAYFTPERMKGLTKTEQDYWQEIVCQVFPSEEYECILVNDNQNNVQYVQSQLTNFHAIKIVNKPTTAAAATSKQTIAPLLLDDALTAILINPYDPKVFQVEDAAYLAAKNRLDEVSRSPVALQAVCERLLLLTKDDGKQNADTVMESAQDDCNYPDNTANYEQKKQEIEDKERRNKLRILDLGAGNLNMLDAIVQGLQATVTNNLNQAEVGSNVSYLKQVTEIEYIAMEQNLAALEAAIEERLVGPGKKLHRIATNQGQIRELIYEGEVDLGYSTIHTSYGLFGQKINKQIKRLVKLTVKVVNLDSMSASAVQYLLQQHSNRHVDYYDLILGSGLVDLLEPQALFGRMRLLSELGWHGGVSSSSSTLLYFPICFTGQTRFLSPGGKYKDTDSAASFWSEVNLLGRRYDRYLQKQQKHYTQLPRLLETMTRFDCHPLRDNAAALSSLSMTYASSWQILPSQHPYLWFALRWFIAKGAILSQQHEDSDEVNGSDERKAYLRTLPSLFHDIDQLASKDEITLQIENVDIIAEMKHINHHNDDDNSSRRRMRRKRLPPFHVHALPSPADYLLRSVDTKVAQQQQEIKPKTRFSLVFTALYTVQVVEEPVPPLISIDAAAASYSYAVEMVYSMVSTGTEMKLYSGQMDSQEPLDLTLASLQQQDDGRGWHYPVRYGYSFVGRIAAAKGYRRVFVFAPHTTCHVIQTKLPLDLNQPPEEQALSAADFHFIPDDIVDLDAVFLPALEAALALVQRAMIIPGERVGILGQRLIGLLVAMVMRSQLPGCYLTVEDVRSDRLERSKKLLLQQNDVGSVTFINPLQEAAADANKVCDVCIEVSGSLAGLQRAISRTRDRGRVILGSWYSNLTNTTDGNQLMNKIFDTRFHRSGLSLQADQVSIIPPEMAAKGWTKQRRFQEVWRVMREVKPSRILFADQDDKEAGSSKLPPVIYLQDEPAVKGTWQRMKDAAALKLPYRLVCRAVVMTFAKSYSPQVHIIYSSIAPEATLIPIMSSRCAIFLALIFTVMLDTITPFKMGLSKAFQLNKGTQYLSITSLKSDNMKQFAELWGDKFSDEEEMKSFKRISTNYLINKFQDCIGEDCTYLRSPREAQDVLRDVLPPVTMKELEKEILRVFIDPNSLPASGTSTSAVSVQDFVENVVTNKYWRQAGPRVVYELIYLDCVYSFYYKKKNLLNNEDYDELKSSLTWEGSMAATVTAKESLFMTAVAAFRRGKSLLSNFEYESLKEELLTSNSWVVQRLPDPLENLGLETFMGYLHRSLKKDE